MTQQVFEQTCEFLGDYVEQVYAEVAENPGSCPMCLASAFFEESSTSIINQLYQHSKDSPIAAAAALNFHRAAVAAEVIAIDEVWEAFTGLYPELEADHFPIDHAQ